MRKLAQVIQLQRHVPQIIAQEMDKDILLKLVYTILEEQSLQDQQEIAAQPAHLTQMVELLDIHVPQVLQKEPNVKMDQVLDSVHNLLLHFIMKNLKERELLLHVYHLKITQLAVMALTVV